MTCYVERHFKNEKEIDKCGTNVYAYLEYTT